MISKKYDDNINYNFFSAHNINIEQILPWQFQLSHPDAEGVFMWYPERGSLIHQLPDRGVHKLGEFTDSEEVYDEIMKKA